MYCSRCGKENRDDAKFCSGCGAPLVGASEPAQSQARQQVEGNCSAAWRDVKVTSSWVTKILLSAIVKFVPILSWNNTGYFMDWGCEVVRGKRETMPQYKVSGPTFTIGIYATVIQVICVIALTICCLVLDIIPVLGFLLGLLLCFLVQPLVDLLMFRSSLFRNFEEGLNLKEVWALCKRKYGSALFISVVPRLLVGLITFGVVLVIFAVFTLAGIGSVSGLSGLMGGLGSSGMFSSGYSSSLLGSSLGGGGIGAYSPSSLFSMLSGLVGVGALLAALFILLAVVALVFILICSTIADAIVYRAYGHLVAREAPDWADAAAKRREEEVVTVPGIRTY